MSNEPVPHEWELLASLAEVLPVNAVAAGGGGGDGNVLQLDCGDGCTTLYVY